MSKSQPKSITPKRLKPSKYRGTKGKSFTGRSNLNSCSVSDSSDSYDARPAYAGNKYLTFVVRTVYGSWRYVRVQEHALDVVSTPQLYDPGMGSDMLEVWKRVVIDDAMPWEDSVDRNTLRIVEYTVNTDDVTESLFTDKDELAEYRRRAALSRLTDSEARLLGLGHQKAKQIIMACPDFDHADGSLLKRLAQNRAEHSLDSFMED